MIHHHSLALTDDRSTIDQFLSTRNPEYFSQLYRKYNRQVFLKCFSLLRNENWAKDATQEIFIRIFLQLPQFKHKSRFSTWLYAITRNYCIDQLRRTGVKKTNVFPDLEIVDVDIEVPLAANTVEQRMQELQQVMQAMPNADRRILMMKFRDKYSIKTIAQRLKLSEGAIKMRIKRAKAKARQLRLELA